MKLRNKKTGEIVDCTPTLQRWNGPLLNRCHYNSLAELNEEWEDYEEPEEWWYIDIHGPHKVTNSDGYYQQVKAASKEIGNYFDTREEAEKAVEKLKAWVRLKDKGFKVDLWDYDGGNYQEKIRTGRILFRVADDYPENNIDKDLDLLFGGEE